MGGQLKQRSHVVQREPQFASVSDEFEAVEVRLRITSLVALGSGWLAQKALGFVEANGLDLRTRDAREFADPIFD